jgi:hypothetical protein
MISASQPNPAPISSRPPAMNGRVPNLSEPTPPSGAKIIGIMVNTSMRTPDASGE